MKTKIMSVFVISASLLLSRNTLAFNYVMGDTLYPDSTQSQTAKGVSYVDSTLHTTITRVTDSASDHGKWGTGCGYSTWNPQSSDGRYLLFLKLSSLNSSSGYALYDATTFQYIKTISQLQWWNSQDPEPRWDASGSYPTRIYYRQDKQLRYVDVYNDSDYLVHDFTADFPAYGSSYYIYNGEEGISSVDSRYWVFMLRNASSPYQTAMLFVYDKTTDQVAASKSLTGNAPNSVSVSLSGNYVYAAYAWDGTGGEFDGPHAYTRNLTNPVKISSGIPHASMAYDKQGNEVVFFMDGDYVSFTRMDTGQRFNIYYQGDMGWDGSNLLHAAILSLKNGWGLVSTYSALNNHWSDNQVFMLELDETKTYGSATLPRIWRISFTQNIVGPSYYYQQPNAQINHEGTKIWWGANWRNVNGSSEVYQYDLPSTWWEDLSGASDTTAPVAVNNLTAATGTNQGQINLSWTAPGDDGSVGTAATYIIKYSASAITTDAQFDAALDIAGEPAPLTAGTSQSMTVSGLAPGQTYYFAMKTQDEVPNISALSNSPSATANQYHPADTNQNGKVEMKELMDFIGKWKSGQANLADVLEIFGRWLKGE